MNKNMPQRISMSEMESISSSSSSPPWLVISLVAYHLDPKTLTIASCVCKSWYVCMSSNHLWEPICSSLYPSLSNLHASNPTVPYRRLFTLGYTAQKRRLQKPTKPQLSLHDIMFPLTFTTAPPAASAPLWRPVMNSTWTVIPCSVSTSIMILVIRLSSKTWMTWGLLGMCCQKGSRAFLQWWIARGRKALYWDWKDGFPRSSRHPGVSLVSARPVGWRRISGWGWERVVMMVLVAREQW